MKDTTIFMKTTGCCITLITLILSIDFKYDLIPLNSIYLIFYVIFVLVLSIWASFVTLQHILNQNKPFTYAEGTFYHKLMHSKTAASSSSSSSSEGCYAPPNGNIDERIEQFVNDIERQFIRRWYVPYISKDETFLQESRHLMDIVTRRYLQIANQINSDRLMHGILIFLLKHVKEFRRTAKKVKNAGNGSIETLYRYSHIGSTNRNALEHFLFQLTSKLLRHFINWELYNSLAAQCLIGILSKKVVATLLVHVSAPAFLNYRIMVKLGANPAKLDAYTLIVLSDIDHTGKLMDDVCAVVQHQQEEEDDDDECDVASSSSLLVVEKVERRGSTTPIMTTQQQPPAAAPVKVYESKATNKTWRNSSDLDCISLGQDILYLSDIGNTSGGGKLWREDGGGGGETAIESLPSVKEHQSMEDFEFINVTASDCQQPNNKTATITTTAAVTLITNTIRPLGHVTAHSVKDTMKDLQMSTIRTMRPMTQATNTAIHKMGDLHDEAAGVVEGIFDFGMAGLRKGLRLTGLQDNIQETVKLAKSERRDIPKMSNNHTNVAIGGGNGNNKQQKLIKLEHVNSDDIKLEESAHNNKQETLVMEEASDNVWVNPLSSTSPSFEGDILLEKSPLIEAPPHIFPPAINLPSMTGSPDPEYEDTTDLATTTAKLRCLLAQKTNETDVVATPSASPLVSLAQTPLDPSGACIEELAEVDGALPSMYKAWAKTATGVFQNTLNTLKTALPGNTNEAQHAQQTAEQVTTARLIPNDVEQRGWLYVQADQQQDDLTAHIARFLNERRAFCTIDNAYEALEAVEMVDQLDATLMHRRQQFDDELDDFDATIPMTKTLIDLICELVEDACPPLVKENVVKLLLLLCGRRIESNLHDIGVKLIKSLNGFIGVLPKFQTDDNINNPSPPSILCLTIDEVINDLLHLFPSVLRGVLQEDTEKHILRLFLESLQSHKINQDTNLHLLELFVSEIIDAANQTSPTFSA